MGMSPVAVSRSFPRGPSPVGYPEPCSWGPSGSSETPRSVLGQESLPLGPPQCCTQDPRIPRNAASWQKLDPADRSHLESRPFLLEGPRVPSSSRYHRRLIISSIPQRLPTRSPRAKQAWGRPCAEVPGRGLDDHGVGGLGTGSEHGQRLGPQSPGPRAPPSQAGLPSFLGSAGHWRLRLEKNKTRRQRCTADTTRVAPGLAPPPAAPPTSPPALLGTGPFSDEPQAEAVPAEPQAMSRGAETGRGPGRASALDTGHRARPARPAGTTRTEVLLQGSRRAEGPRGGAAPSQPFFSPPAPHPPLQTFPLHFAWGCLPPLL